MGSICSARNVRRFDGRLNGKWTLHAAFISAQTEENYQTAPDW